MILLKSNCIYIILFLDIFTLHFYENQYPGIYLNSDTSKEERLGEILVTGAEEDQHQKKNFHDVILIRPGGE